MAGCSTGINLPHGCTTYGPGQFGQRSTSSMAGCSTGVNVDGKSDASLSTLETASDSAAVLSAASN
eukprot:CAMPEP_0198589134 /NCGR_PEP_ID=MMETSP1462-20131121/134003_1 /TAXON_ID=1333877 /ORGANISM="Brandtodinium nutriculum, Strain RCC3387" /LENGTH=65 /DNA_ID=CAMNT_0044320645 /DNA_START=18 /DNA_END=212 /DNA_ORIENTATION=-